MENLLGRTLMPPVINEQKCIKCNKCAEICSEDVFYGSKKGEFPTVTYPRECVHFNGCVSVCPVHGAISLRIPLPIQLVFKPEADPL
jgi:NAD-dependent dihydropyrimidine dehydrogenase PreA subunit